jgi:16S rRNA (cytidine1402-2'-O)-methyltransferase
MQNNLNKLCDNFHRKQSYHIVFTEQWYNLRMGKLYLVSTPIGNLEDITIRAIKTLFTCDAILCEDTRHTGLLIQELTKRYSEVFDFNYDWKPKLIPYYDEIEEKKLPEVIELLSQGKHLALVSDAGTPLISDPGYRIVRECIKRRIPVESIPGSSAILAALTSSGLPPDKFIFLGYPPEKQAARIELFKKLQPHITTIFYCAPHKLLRIFEDIQFTLGNIEIAIGRELTKVHEEVWKGKISEAISHFNNPKGEIVLLFQIH